MKKENLDVRAAKWAKANGYTHITTIVKNVYTTDYYNVVEVDQVILSEKWVAAPRLNGFSCSRGLRYSQFSDLKTISRQEARNEVKKLETC